MPDEHAVWHGPGCNCSVSRTAKVEARLAVAEELLRSEHSIAAQGKHYDGTDRCPVCAFLAAGDPDA